MTDQPAGRGNETPVNAALRAAIQNVIAAGGAPDEIRTALGLDDTTNILHVQNSTQQIQINTLDGSAYFVQDGGPSWVEYKDHRPSIEWENVVSPETFDPGLRIRTSNPDGG
jgi:hypothetical protein